MTATTTATGGTGTGDAVVRRPDRAGSTRRVRATAVVAAVLVLSFVPIGIEQATPATKAMLTVIHIAVAVALVPMLRTPARRRA
jgi:heme A synthase